MADLLIEQDKVVVKIGRGGTIAAIIVVSIFLLIGGGILAFFFSLWSATGFDLRTLANLFNGEDDDSIILLVFGIIGIAFTLIPLFVLTSLFSGKKKPKEPQTLIFDNQSRRFCISEQAWDPQAYTTNALSLPAYGYDQLQEFRLRTYTTSSSSSSGSSSSTTHYVACLIKKDGGIWDLHDSTSRRSSEDFLARVSSAVRLGGNLGDPGTGQFTATPVLPSRILRIPVAGSTLFCWTTASHFGGIIIGLLFIAGFLAIMLRVASDALPFLIFGGVIIGIFALVLLKGLWDGFVSLRYFHCLRLWGDSIHVGLVPKALLNAGREADGSLDRSFVPDSTAIDQAFKSQKKLDMRAVSRVQYSWRTADRRTLAPEILLIGESATAEADALSLGNIRFSQLIKTAKAMQDGTVTISLSGLSVGETMAFERILEQEIAQRGGSAS
jgi:hypothetical protein